MGIEKLVLQLLLGIEWLTAAIIVADEIFAPHALRFEGTAPHVKYSICV